MTTFLYPVILAGGSGTRLWPLSRHNFPKQFLRLQGQSSLLQQTIERVTSLNCQNTLIVSNDAHYFLCKDQLNQSQTQITYLLEPCARNTAPAIACAAQHLIHQAGEEAIMLVLPSDHWIEDIPSWKKAMLKGCEFVKKNDAIVTFGVNPTSPKTGYGYIEGAETIQKDVHKVNSFREKPDEETAQEFIRSQRYFWNSGMFICKAKVYLEELQHFEPELYQFAQIALMNATQHHDFFRLEMESFAQCKSESIDYAIMEKTQKAVVIPISIQWSDLGCWAAVADANQQDQQGNTITGKVITKDSHNCFINSEDLLVTTIGIQNQIIVATSDAILVADKRYSQDVKELVQSLSTKHHQLTQDHQKVNRPWGYFEVLAEGPSFKVKRLMIKPGAKLSLQLHEHRAEHWVVVAGQADVINDGQRLRLSVNQSTYIPQRTRHRLSNPGDEPLFVIEVQSGVYLGEDDITRFDDVYARNLTEL